MKTAREFREDILRAVSEPGKVQQVAAALDKLIEADRRELVEACAKEADPACDCDSVPPRHDECKGARDAMHRIRALIPKEDSRG